MRLFISKEGSACFLHFYILDGIETEDFQCVENAN